MNDDTAGDIEERWRSKFGCANFLSMLAERWCGSGGCGFLAERCVDSSGVGGRVGVGSDVVVVVAFAARCFSARRRRSSCCMGDCDFPRRGTEVGSPKASRETVRGRAAGPLPSTIPHDGGGRAGGVGRLGT